MSNKTATITWIKYNNYGTLLQCYALQYAIKKIGYSNKILDDSWFIEPYQKSFRYRVSYFVKKILSLLLSPFSIHYFDDINNETVKLCRLFVRDYLDVDYDVRNLDLVADRYDCFICGSDQIWNPGPQWYKRLNTPFYYAGFTNKKKIAYGPSLGVTEYPEKHKKEFEYYLSSFASLSCRESEGCEVIKQITGKTVEKVVDPTLLLDEKEWRVLIGPPRKKNGYVLCYFLSNNVWYTKYVYDYIEKTGLELYVFDNTFHGSLKYDRVLHTGPKEFLEYIDGADFVFTDSFHATLFSALLETEFVTFERFANNRPEYAQNMRLMNLFSIIKVYDRYITSNVDADIYRLLSIDFDKIRDNLKSAIDNSLNYLIGALE